MERAVRWIVRGILIALGIIIAVWLWDVAIKPVATSVANATVSFFDDLTYDCEVEFNGRTYRIDGEAECAELRLGGFTDRVETEDTIVVSVETPTVAPPIEEDDEGTTPPPSDSTPAFNIGGEAFNGQVTVPSGHTLILLGYWTVNGDRMDDGGLRTFGPGTYDLSVAEHDGSGTYRPDGEEALTLWCSYYTYGKTLGVEHFEPSSWAAQCG